MAGQSKRDWSKLDPHLVDDERLDRLSERLGVDRTYALGVVCGLTLYAFSRTKEGEVSARDRERLASALGWKDVNAILDALEGLFISEGRIIGWKEWGGALHEERRKNAERQSRFKYRIRVAKSLARKHYGDAGTTTGDISIYEDDSAYSTSEEEVTVTPAKSGDKQGKWVTVTGSGEKNTYYAGSSSDTEQNNMQHNRDNGNNIAYSKVTVTPEEVTVTKQEVTVTHNACKQKECDVDNPVDNLWITHESADDNGNSRSQEVTVTSNKHCIDSENPDFCLGGEPLRRGGKALPVRSNLGVEENIWCSSQLTLGLTLRQNEKTCFDSPDESPGDLEGIDEFLAVYPRRERVSDAKRYWRKLTRRERAMALQAARAVSYAVQNGYRELRYVPQAATWLHQKRWHDWYDSAGHMVVPAGWKRRGRREMTKEVERLERLAKVAAEVFGEEEECE